MSFIQATYRAAVFTVVLAAWGPAAYAQQPSAAALASAKEFVALTGATQIFGPLVAGVVEQSKMLYLQQNPALSKDLNEISAKLKAELTPRLAELDVEMVRIYATRFTEAELKEIMAFYGSPTGKKVLVEQPQAAEQSLKFAQDWSIKLSDEVVGKMREELKKRGHNP
jgi:hypothetical protein